MALELSSALLDMGVELSGARVAAGVPTPGSQADRPVAPERFGAHQVLRYAVSDDADTYRRIMRVLYLEHQAFGLRLRPAQVADLLRERYEINVPLDWLEERLESLRRW